MENEIKEDIIDRRLRSIFGHLSFCIEELIDLSGEGINISITHSNDPLYYTIIVQNDKQDKIGINIHKLK